DVDQSVRNRRRGDGTVDLVIAPHGAGTGDVAGLGPVDAAHRAVAVAVLGTLADGEVDAAVVHHRRRHHLARAARRRRLVLHRLAVFSSILRWVAIKSPSFLERLRLQAVTPPVAGAEDDQSPAIERAVGGAGPVR